MEPALKDLSGIEEITKNSTKYVNWKNWGNNRKHFPRN